MHQNRFLLEVQMQNTHFFFLLKFFWTTGGHHGGASHPSPHHPLATGLTVAYPLVPGCRNKCKWSDSFSGGLFVVRRPCLDWGWNKAVIDGRQVTLPLLWPCSGTGGTHCWAGSRQSRGWVAQKQWAQLRVHLKWSSVHKQNSYWLDSFLQKGFWAAQYVLKYPKSQRVNKNWLLNEESAVGLFIYLFLAETRTISIHTN